MADSGLVDRRVPEPNQAETAITRAAASALIARLVAALTLRCCTGAAAAGGTLPAFAAARS